MEVLSFIEHSFFKSDLCKNLFNLEFIIYGKFIRQILSNQFDDESNIINLYGKLSYKEIVEKLLNEHIFKKTIISPITNIFNKYVIGNYYIKLDGKTYILDILFVNDLHIENLIYFKKELCCPINIDGLYLSDSGLGVLNHIKDRNTIFSILEDIKYKRFKVIEILTVLSYKDIVYIQKLVDLGYRNMNRAFKRYINNYECKICYEDEDKHYSELSCGHIFHTKCLKESVNEVINNDITGLFKCPYCQTKYINYEVI